MGLAKDLVNAEWFESQYQDMSRTKQVKVESNFRIDWHTLDIMKKEYLRNLGIQVNTKREAVFDENNIWVDTKPKHVIDFGGQESSILEILDRELKIMKHENALIKEQLDNKDREYASLEEEVAKLREEIQSNTQLPEDTESPTLLEVTKPTLYMQKPKQKKKEKKKKKQKKKGPG